MAIGAYGVGLEAMAERLGIQGECLRVLAQNHMLPYLEVDGEMRFDVKAVGYALRAWADRVAPIPPSTAWPPEYLDIKGVAHLLCVSQKQVQRLISRERLPMADINVSGTGNQRGRRWRRESVIAHLQARPY